MFYGSNEQRFNLWDLGGKNLMRLRDLVRLRGIKAVFIN